MKRVDFVLGVTTIIMLPGVVLAQKAVAPATISSTVRSSIQTTGDNPRVIVTAMINGHPMKMMVHSYASMFAQLKHDQAKAFGVRLTPGTNRRYGIDRGGHVSPLGRDEAVATSLSVGKSVVQDAPVSVFEVPQDRYGMLGTRWIALNRVVVDFARNEVMIAPTPGQTKARAAALLRAGYVALPMHYDEASRFYFTKATINGVTREMAITTASGFNIDAAFADVLQLQRGRDVGEGDGPTGTDVPNYLLATPVRVMIGSWTSPLISDGRICDNYAYIASQRPTDPAMATGGQLGGAFLRETGAVVDFGTLTLFVKSEAHQSVKG